MTIPKELNNNTGGRHIGIADVRGAAGLHEQKVSFLSGNGAVLNSSGHDKQFTRSQLNVAIAELTRHLPLEHHDEVVSAVVLVPPERLLDLHDHHVVAVELANSPGLVVVDEGVAPFQEMDGLHGYLSK